MQEQRLSTGTAPCRVSSQHAVDKERTNPLAVLAGMDEETAQKEYITLVKSLAEKYAK